MVHPHRCERAPESALAGYLDAAREIFARAGSPDLTCGRGPRISPDFEELLWFELPEVCLS
jgi:hypothetical protein